MKAPPGNHNARRAAAKAEPSPITALRDMLATAYAADIAAVMPEVCEVLHEEINTLPTPARRDHIRTALLILERNPGALAMDVAQEFRARFDMKIAPGEDPFSKTSRLSISDFALMDDSVLRLDLALDQCAARLKEQAATEVFQLTARVAEMLGKQALDEAENPIVPRVFARALLEALGKMGFDDEQRLAIFKAFGPALLHIAPDLYAHANSLLMERGVLADFKSLYGRPVNLGASLPPKKGEASPSLDEGVLTAILERLLKGERTLQQ